MITTQRQHYDKWCSRIRAFDGSKQVGQVTVCNEDVEGYHDKVLSIIGIWVLDEYQRKGIGTKLYEEAAAIACEKGLPLASSPDWARTKFSTGFWDKQLRKGRVTRIDEGVHVLKKTCGADLSEIEGTRLWPWYTLMLSMGGLWAYTWAKRKGLVGPEAFYPGPAWPQTPAGPQNVHLALQNASGQTGVPLGLLMAVAKVESNFNPTAVSRAGATGLMQLMPATAHTYNVANPYDVNQNALGGARFLADLYTRYGNWTQALAAYNWGPTNVRKKPLYKQWPKRVHRYIARVQRYWKTA